MRIFSGRLAVPEGKCGLSGEHEQVRRLWWQKKKVR
jgi:hypothetical protein